MEADHLQAIAARDQFWSNLRLLLPEIERLAAGQFEGTEREQQIMQLLAKIAVAELQFRKEHTEAD